MRAFADHWAEAWNTLEEGIEEVHEMLAEDRICRAAILDGRVVGWIGGIPEYDGNVWKLHPLAGHPDFHGQGSVAHWWKQTNVVKSVFTPGK